MSTVGHPDYQRVTHGFVSSVVSPSTVYPVAAGGSQSVSFGFPLGPDVTLVSVQLPNLTYCYAEVQDLNGQVEATKSIGSINSGNPFSFPVRSLGGPVFLHLVNPSAVPVNFIAAVQGFIGLSPLEFVRDREYNFNFGRVVAPAASSPIVEAGGGARFNTFAYYMNADQAYTPVLDFLTLRAAGWFTQTLPLPAAAAGVPTQGSVPFGAIAMGCHVVNNGGVNATVDIQVTAMGVN